MDLLKELDLLIDALYMVLFTTISTKHYVSELQEKIRWNQLLSKLRCIRIVLGDMKIPSTLILTVS